MIFPLLGLLACAPDAPMGARMMALLDPNGDGVLSAAEFEAVALPGEPFADLDTDGNGVIDVAELDRALRETSPTAWQQARKQALRRGGPR